MNQKASGCYEIFSHINSKKLLVTKGDKADKFIFIGPIGHSFPQFFENIGLFEAKMTNF
jgi:hypothetical protein